MSDLITRTARLVPYAKRPKHISSFVTAYLYEPITGDIGAWLGNLYVVVEVLISGRASEEVVDLVIETAGEKYYNEPDGEKDPLARFEAAIKQINHALSEYVGKGNASWIGKLSAIIAVQSGHELHVAQTGSAEAFLYRGKAASRISIPETNRPTTPSKTFGSIATGELEAGDKLLIATPALVHQVPLAKLQSVVTNGSPNSSIAEISQLLDGAITNRIAALVIEITTPELAALKVRSDEPEEIQLASNESLTDAAIRAATPLAQTTAATSKKVAGAAKSSWYSLRPKLRTAGLRGADAIRRLLATRRGRWAALITFFAVILLVIIMNVLGNSRAATAKKFSDYQSLFTRYTQAASAHPTDKSAALDSLNSVSAQLAKLSASDTSKINNQLKNNALLEGEPTSVSAFKQLVANQIDLLDGLIKVSPLTVAEIGKNGRPTHFESDGTHAYVIDSANHNAISIVSLSNGVQKDSSADTSGLGDVVATTVAASNDSMFILTSKPSVWVYRFATDTLVEQTIAYGQWPKARSIASYGSNLYLLGDGAVYKNVHNATGYSPKSDYISTTKLNGLPSALAVDGWVYVASGTSLNRYLAASLKASVQMPASLDQISNLRSTAGGDVLVGTSKKSNRIALWTSKTDQLAFDKQIELSGSKTLYDATYDARLGRIFATVDNRLVSFSLKP